MNLSSGSLAVKAVGAVVVLGVVFACAPFFEVQQTNRTVVTNWGKTSYVADPGPHFKVPLMQGLITFPVTTQASDLPKLNTYTIDSQEMFAFLKVQYRVPPEKVMYVYTNMGTEYVSKLDTMVVDRFKNEIGRVNAIDFPNQRGKIMMQVLATVQQEAARLYGIEVSDVQLVNFDWNEAYKTAISNASVAKAKVDQQEQEKRQAQVRAEQDVVVAQGTANANVATSEGEAKAKRIQADADAYTVNMAGKARADALRLENDALANNASLVALTWANHWNGILPTTTYGGNPVPMVMGK